ncbi:MAG: hypothetical protein EOR11_13885 [Mesorhizobium sp.]|uniref:hypothetical protein n=1 Tax=Mesorhizobium sp. TaxID=1871066 RepID=UPI000FE88CE9|nr:hypothetical protein [Mesorhizobium sp.]RWP87409.1 MAG: hypothetical protein EOR11_13885 [Mesorhizobium sp.]
MSEDVRFDPFQGFISVGMCLNGAFQAQLPTLLARKRVDEAEHGGPSTPRSPFSLMEPAVPAKRTKQQRGLCPHAAIDATLADIEQSNEHLFFLSQNASISSNQTVLPFHQC